MKVDGKKLLEDVSCVLVLESICYDEDGSPSGASFLKLPQEGVIHEQCTHNWYVSRSQICYLSCSAFNRSNYITAVNNKSTPYKGHYMQDNPI